MRRVQLGTLLERNPMLPMLLPVVAVSFSEGFIVVNQHDIFSIRFLRRLREIEAAGDDFETRPVGVDQNNFVMRRAVAAVEFDLNASLF